jgi:hypothetical protein
MAEIFSYFAPVGYTDSGMGRGKQNRTDRRGKRDDGRPLCCAPDCGLGFLWIKSELGPSGKEQISAFSSRSLSSSIKTRSWPNMSICSAPAIRPNLSCPTMDSSGAEGLASQWIYLGQKDWPNNGFISTEGLAQQWIYLGRRISLTMDLSGH